MSAISALAWVPRGAARPVPLRYKPSDDELATMAELAMDESGIDVIGELEEEKMLEEDRDPLAVAAEAAEAATAAPARSERVTMEELGMDAYDDADEVDAMVETREPISAMGAVHEFVPHDEIEDEADADDYNIGENDALLLVARSEEDYSAMEVHLYDASNYNLFVHHEFALAAFPLALAWMDCPPVEVEEGATAGVGNYVAVGTFHPSIEIWNLDVLDVLEPSAVLGSEDGHKEAVMSLAWNRNRRNMLASGSADNCIVLWDVSTCSVLHRAEHHADKVNAVSWNPFGDSILASASFDRSAAILDMRSPDIGTRIPLSADPEAVEWNPHVEPLMLVATEDGIVTLVDVRNPAEPIWSFAATDRSISSVSWSTRVPGLFGTAGTDGLVRLWDAAAGGEPELCAERDMKGGTLFTMQFFADEPYVLAAAGSLAQVAIWDTAEASGMERRFDSRIVDSVEQAVEIGISVSDVSNDAEVGALPLPASEPWGPPAASPDKPKRKRRGGKKKKKRR